MLPLRLIWQNISVYKAYRQDDDATNEVTSINAEDLLQVVKYTDKSIMSAGGYGLEPDFHNNFRPEPEYENGVESLWANAILHERRNKER